MRRAGSGPSARRTVRRSGHRRRPTSSRVAPSSADGTIYVGTNDGFIVALDGATGSRAVADAAPPAPPASTPQRSAVGWSTRAPPAPVSWPSTRPAIRSAWTADDGCREHRLGVGHRRHRLHRGERRPGLPSGPSTPSTRRPGHLAGRPPNRPSALPTVADGVTYSASTRGLLGRDRLRPRVRLCGGSSSRATSGPRSSAAASSTWSPTSAQRVYAVEATTGDELWTVRAGWRPRTAVSRSPTASLFIGDQGGHRHAIGGDGAAIVAHRSRRSRPIQRRHR